jgi:N-acetylneuraminic acid mutarotase
VIDGKLYVAGGFHTATLDVYDPATNSWTTRAPVPTGGAMSKGAVLGGKFYVVVQDFDGTTGSVVNRAYVYKPGTNRWEATVAPDFFGSMTRVTLDGRRHLFMAGGDRSALYTP